MRRHELDLTSLVAGLVFVAIAVAYLVGQLHRRARERGLGAAARASSGWAWPGLTGSVASGACAPTGETPNRQ